MTQAIAQPTNQTTLLMDLVEELSEVETLDSLNEIKTGYDDKLIKEAWKLLSDETKLKIHRICDPHSVKMATAIKTETKPELRVIKQVEEPAKYTVPQAPKSKTLLELSTELKGLDDLIESLEELDGQAQIDLDSAIKDLFEQHQEISEQFIGKIDNYLGLIQNLNRWAEARKAESERIKKLAEIDAKKAEFLQERLKKVLESMEVTKLKTNRFNLSICKNGGKTPIVFDDTNPKDIPSKYQRVIYEFDKESIRKALDSGEELTFASFSERGTHLRIK